ncbi:hypothetical protein LDENG_00278390 [Lucifuga dentata]|nr:hypothetical protein LDENG_00278390 [Lucifuga dentata]
MSCVEKRHMSHRMGSMLHHRFPSGFTDLFMDETDREVSTLTDRAFRSLCVGDDAVYNDDSYGYSPFSCHKPLAEEPLKKILHKESKKQGHHHSQRGKNDAQSWKQQQNMSHVSSFLKALSATEESCEGMLIKNGGMKDTNGESWDKSALRSIQRELSEFSSDYHTNLTDGHYKNHHRHPSGDKPPKKTGKDAGKSSKNKNGKAVMKLKKLNIKNFFLHSEFSPFQTWRDFNQFPFSQEDTVTSILPTDNIPKCICQLMTPVIPSRQPTETSEILQAILSPSALDLPLSPDSEAKLTPEPPVKREGYKSLASSILFNLKDNRKRVKSRYSPPKFKLLELPEHSTQSPQPDHQIRSQAGSDGNVSGLSTPAILKDGQTICSPASEPASTPNVGLQKQDADKPISDDYLLSNLLQSKREAAGSRTVGEENQLSAFIRSRKNKSPVANKKSYPSLNLYKKKRSPVDNGNVTQNQVAEEPDKTNKASEDISIDEDILGEIPRKIISPLLLVNGISIDQSPPDQASLSSKSSYFSVESALHRNTESESNIYHSIENLIGELDEAEEVTGNVLGNQREDSERTEVEYYSVSDHESEPEVIKRPTKNPQKGAPYKEGREPDKDKTSLPHDVNDQTPMSPSSIVSPPLGIPALFKVKDNTVINKTTKSIHPWSPRESLSVLERGWEELYQIKETPELTPTIETAPSKNTSAPTEIPKPKEILSDQLTPLLLSPLNLRSENQRKPQVGSFLTVPQEEDRNSGVSPSSEGVESLTTSTTDTADEMGLNTGVLQEREVSKLPSEWSGSTCSGNDSQNSQTGLPKPPAILPKSERAVLKAMKLTNRRIKKEEAQNKSSHKSSQSSSKPKTDKHKNDKSKHEKHEEHKSSSNSRNGEKHGKSSEKKLREKLEHSHRRSESLHNKDSNDRNVQRRSHSSENHRQRTDNSSQKTGHHSGDQTESNNQDSEALSGAATERQGRSTDRHVRDKPEQRNYSSDRVISNVPVYKAYIAERPVSDRPCHRSQSSDRYFGDTVQRRHSTDTTTNEKLDLRSQRIEKSIMDEFQQRGRVRERANRENPLRRSHSIDAYSVEVPHPPGLSRQSSHASQLSRQSSIEHAIVTQSFPITQRKILQDPDSGQYFVVDMPIQVKTKTFFDPATGTYVQLPVQPQEGALPQASAMEVLSPPLVVYHGFVPVPLSPMAQKSTIQAPHMEPEPFEQRHLQRSRQMYSQEGRPYLEAVYSQHDNMLGEFLGTEELDCVS